MQKVTQLITIGVHAAHSIVAYRINKIVFRIKQDATTIIKYKTNP